MRALARLLLLGTAVVLALACSGSGSPQASVAPEAAKSSDVAAEGFIFKPATLEVSVGTKVTWTNKDAAEHTVTAGKPDSKESTFFSVIAPGASFTFTFDKAGVFVYFCERHPSMTGTVTVK